MEGMVNFFYKNNVLVVSHIFTAVTIFVIAIVTAKLFNLLVSRWEKKIVANLEKKHATTISSVETKTMIIRRIVNTGIYFFALILFLLQFESVRSIGAGLLASAGVAGIVIGMAAQNTLSNIVAGISISFASR